MPATPTTATPHYRLPGRTMVLLETVGTGIESLLDEWADAADRSKPVEGCYVVRAAELLGQSRRLLARSAVRASVPPLRPDATIMPGELFVRLLSAYIALSRLVGDADLSP
jgi:hypothetical protein